jgi:Flp pilus assembly pilin Flp
MRVPIHLGRLEAWRNQRLGEHGATAVEYGLLIAFVAAIIAVSVAALGQTVLGLFSSVPSF